MQAGAVWFTTCVVADAMPEVSARARITKIAVISIEEIAFLISLFIFIPFAKIASR